MNKKSIVAVLALILLAIALLMGLPFAANRTVADSMKQTVTETITPPPSFDDYVQ